MATHDSTTVPVSGTPNPNINSLLDRSLDIAVDELVLIADGLRAIGMVIGEGIAQE